MKYIERFSPAWSESSIYHIATPSSLAKSIFFYAQEIGYFKTSASYFIDHSNINSFLLIYTLSGKGILRYLNKEYVISEGQLIFIDCMNHHYLKTDSSNLWEIYWIHFNGCTCKGYYDFFASLSSPIVNLQTTSRIPFLFLEILNLHQNKENLKEIMTSQRIMTIITELLTSRYPQKNSTSDPNLIARLQTFIEHHFNESINLDSIAQSVSMSKFHVSNIFKKHTGYSPIDYLISVRITYAKELLHFTDLSINEISKTIGIDNVSHFINLFNNREGITPLCYRKLWKA